MKQQCSNKYSTYIKQVDLGFQSPQPQKCSHFSEMWLELLWTHSKRSNSKQFHFNFEFCSPVTQVHILRKCNLLVGFIYTFVFHFFYQFNLRIGILVNSSFAKWLAQKNFNNISASFQNLFVVVFTWKRM